MGFCNIKIDGLSIYIALSRQTFNHKSGLQLFYLYPILLLTCLVTKLKNTVTVFNPNLGNSTSDIKLHVELNTQNYGTFNRDL